MGEKVWAFAFLGFGQSIPDSAPFSHHPILSPLSLSLSSSIPIPIRMEDKARLRVSNVQ